MINNNNKQYFLKDFILNIKINNKPLFIGMEEGTRKFTMHVYVMFEQKMRNEAHKQVSNTYTKYAPDGIISVPPI